MKKFLMLALFASTLLACNNVENKNEEAAKPVEATQPHEEARTLTLSNGAKWQSDESTTRNVKELQAIVNRLNENKNQTLENYTAVANELQPGLDKMIKECRMQGADHDALHLWLEPLLANVNSLKKATVKENASKTFIEIEQHVNSYNQFFE
jgi:hypothetical protein